MPQVLLPLFPEGVVHLSPDLAVSKDNGKVIYFNGSMPVFTHDESDLDSFHMIIAQFCCSGYVKQADVVRALGVTPISLKRAVKTYREKGAKGFYAAKRTRGPAVLTDEVISKAQDLLLEGRDVPEVAERLGLKADTVRKAVRDGRLFKPKKKRSNLKSPNA